MKEDLIVQIVNLLVEHKVKMIEGIEMCAVLMCFQIREILDHSSPEAVEFEQELRKLLMKYVSRPQDRNFSRN